MVYGGMLHSDIVSFTCISMSSLVGRRVGSIEPVHTTVFQKMNPRVRNM